MLISLRGLPQNWLSLTHACCDVAAVYSTLLLNLFDHEKFFFWISLKRSKHFELDIFSWLCFLENYEKFEIVFGFLKQIHTGRWSDVRRRFRMPNRLFFSAWLIAICTNTRKMWSEARPFQLTSEIKPLDCLPKWNKNLLHALPLNQTRMWSMEQSDFNEFQCWFLLHRDRNKKRIFAFA